MAPGTISYPSHSCATFTVPIATMTKASSSKVSESAKATPEHIQVATAAAERVFIAPAPRFRQAHWAWWPHQREKHNRHDDVFPRQPRPLLLFQRAIARDGGASFVTARKKPRP